MSINRTHCIPSILRFSLFFLFRRKVIRVYSTLALIRLRIVRGVYRGCELNLSYKWNAVIMTTYFFVQGIVVMSA